MSRKSVRRWLVALALVVLAGAVGWTAAFRLGGLTEFGVCTFADGDNTVTLRHDVALKKFDALFAAKARLSRASISCSYAPTAAHGEPALNDLGLTTNANGMFEAVRKDFDFIPWGGFGPGGVTTGHIKGSAHYEGRAVDFFFKPYDSSYKKKAGWRLAQWAVMHADELHIATVIYDDKIWSRNFSVKGWRDFVYPDSKNPTPTMRHLDHVHIDVY